MRRAYLPVVILCLPFIAAVSAYPAATAPLTILKPAASDMEDATVPPSFTFVPGQVVFLSFEIGGYKASDDQRVHLSYKIDVLDPKGVRLLDTITAGVDTTVSEEDKNWKPKVRVQFPIPPLAGSGTYKVAIQVHDDLTKADASQNIEFPVRGHDVAPSETLVVRNFHFYRSEDDPAPLAVAAYRPGDTLWARFDITGYKLGSGNSIDLDYGIAVLAPGGKVLYTQPQPAVEKTASFYPQAYTPGSMNLSLEKGIKPAQYTIVLTVRDHTGNQTYETKETFSIEQ